MNNIHSFACTTRTNSVSASVDYRFWPGKGKHGKMQTLPDVIVLLPSVWYAHSFPYPLPSLLPDGDERFEKGMGAYKNVLKQSKERKKGAQHTTFRPHC